MPPTSRRGRRNVCSMVAAAWLVAAALVAVPGCVVAAIASGVGATVLYVKGELTSTVNGGPPEVVAAALSTLDEMSLTVLESDSSELDGKVDARTALDKKIAIRVKRLSDTTSELSIRVGTFGDEVVSRQIHRGIKDRLAPDEPAAENAAGDDA